MVETSKKKSERGDEKKIIKELSPGFFLQLFLDRLLSRSNSEIALKITKVFRGCAGAGDCGAPSHRDCRRLWCSEAAVVSAFVVVRTKCKFSRSDTDG